MDIRTKEAVRYLGYGSTAVDEATLLMIQDSFRELDEISEPKSVYRIFTLGNPCEDELKICNLHIKSKDLQKNLRDCKQAVVFGATLGTAVDRRLRSLEVADIARAVVFQACAAAYLEEYCDALQDSIANELTEKGLFLKPRFSPGYGDFSIFHQKDVLEIIDAPKKIGLAMTESCMLVPTKSVTALIGICKRS